MQNIMQQCNVLDRFVKVDILLTATILWQSYENKDYNLGFVRHTYVRHAEELLRVSLSTAAAFGHPIHSVPETRRTAALESQQQTCSAQEKRSAISKTLLVFLCPSAVISFSLQLLRESYSFHVWRRIGPTF